MRKNRSFLISNRLWTDPTYYWPKIGTNVAQYKLQICTLLYLVKLFFMTWLYISKLCKWQFIIAMSEGLMCFLKQEKDVSLPLSFILERPRSTQAGKEFNALLVLKTEKDEGKLSLFIDGMAVDSCWSENVLHRLMHLIAWSLLDLLGDPMEVCPCWNM